MESLFKNIPCGQSIPLNNPHAVSVSLPKISDVIGYEEGDKSIVLKMNSGYPRFFRNKFVQQLVDYVHKKYNISSDYLVIPITSIKAYAIISYLINKRLDLIEVDDCVFLIVHYTDDKLKEIKEYIQNTGLIISSRKAEKTLYNLSLIDSVFHESKIEFVEAISNIKNVITNAYSVNEKNVILTNNGANSVFAVCEGILSRGYKGKRGVVQLGWLYVDTMEIVKKRADYVHVHLNVFDLDNLENWLKDNHQEIGLIVSEIVSNPKIECLDIEKVYEICKRYDVLLVLDSTLVTPFNVKVLDYCDIAVESLSKFASGNADLLMGVIVSKNANLLLEIEKFSLPPYVGEIERLGFEILNYEGRIKKISENTIKLIEYFSGHQSVKKVMSVNSNESKPIYQRISGLEVIPGLISVVFNGRLSDYYDKLQLAKGPSLGTEFTLAMPYVYLAHYDLIQTDSGVKYLKNNGIDTELLRISVGLEPIEEIISVFESVFEKQNSCNFPKARNLVCQS